MKSKIFVVDIETTPIEAYIWKTGEQHISIDQIKKDWELAAFGAKEFLKPANQVVYQDRRVDKGELPLLKTAWKILDEADILITQYGSGFDVPKLMAKFIEYRLGKPSAFVHYDTQVLAQKAAAFTSTKLSYLTALLNSKYKKLSHNKFPGLTLWIECLNGNKEAWEEMEKYNVQDVLSTEELVSHLKEYAPKIFPNLDAEVCGGCKKLKVVRVKCSECARWETKK